MAARKSKADQAAEITATLDHLRSLASDPAAQRDAVLRELDATRVLDVARFAISILGEARDAANRDPLLAKYRWCDDQPKKRDPGGFVREALLAALRPIALPDDVDICQRAMTTVEMDGPFEVASNIRSAGLLTLNEVDSSLAGIWAARLIHDGEAFSGQPALTAVTLLAAQGNLAPIYGLAMGGNARSDVLSAALSSLSDLPSVLLPEIVDRFIDSDDDQVVLGLFDLLLAHPTRDEWSTTVAMFLRTTTRLDIYGIVAMDIVASRSGRLIDLLREIRSVETDPRKRPLLDAALALA